MDNYNKNRLHLPRPTILQPGKISFNKWREHYYECLDQGYRLIQKYCYDNNIDNLLDLITYQDYEEFMYNSSSKIKQKYI